MILNALYKYRVGIFATLIFHLCALILLMAMKISTVSQQISAAQIEISFEDEEQLRKEELRRLQAELAAEIRRQRAENDIEAELKRQMQSPNAQQLRNVAVNEETPADERKSDVLRENDELQKRISATYDMMRERGGADDVKTPAKSQKNKSDKVYTGPSVLSYFLKNREAHYLPVPVYKCEGGGEVKVIIVVSATGTVIDARIDKAKSSPDDCLWEMATNAAYRSKFSANDRVARQEGHIVYKFQRQ
jgi:hypothetical protein